MKITKYIHSCLLIEENNKTILIDPGIYTFNERVLDINSLTKLDYILITHEHQDHMYVPAIKDVMKRLPSVKIISNSSVKKFLEKENIYVSTEETEVIKMQEVPHEKVVGVEPPLNVQFDIFGEITDPGDSHSFTSTLEVLALPIQAPWGSYSSAIELAIQLKPKAVIPIHDWHWKDEARKELYVRSKEYLKQFGVKFMPVEAGQTIEV